MSTTLADDIVAECAAAADELWTSRRPALNDAFLRTLLADFWIAYLAGALSPTVASSWAVPLAGGWTAGAAAGGPFFRALELAGVATTSELDDRVDALRVHPGVHVLPVVLTEAAADRLPPGDLLRAIQCGYEITLRLGAHLGQRSSWMHPHGSWMSAVVAGLSCTVSGAGSAVTTEAMRLALETSNAPPMAAVTSGATSRNCYASIVVATGLICAANARAGVTGYEAAVDHVIALGQRQERDAPLAVGSPGVDLQPWIRAKAVPVCNSLQPFVLALRAAALDVDRHDIERIVISGPAQLQSMGFARPASTLAAKFSFPYSIAYELVHGIGIDGHASVDDKRVLDLADVTEVVAGEGGSTLTVHVRGGRAHRIDVPAETMSGPALTPELVRQKARGLVAAGAPDSTEALIDGLLDGRSTAIAEVLDAVRSGAPH